MPGAEQVFSRCPSSEGMGGDWGSTQISGHASLHSSRLSEQPVRLVSCGLLAPCPAPTPSSPPSLSPRSLVPHPKGLLPSPWALGWTALLLTGFQFHRHGRVIVSHSSEGGRAQGIDFGQTHESEGTPHFSFLLRPSENMFQWALLPTEAQREAGQPRRTNHLQTDLTALGRSSQRHTPPPPDRYQPGPSSPLHRQPLGSVSVLEGFSCIRSTLEASSTLSRLGGWSPSLQTCRPECALRLSGVCERRPSLCAHRYAHMPGFSSSHSPPLPLTLTLSSAPGPSAPASSDADPDKARLPGSPQTVPASAHPARSHTPAPWTRRNSTENHRDADGTGGGLTGARCTAMFSNARSQDCLKRLLGQPFVPTQTMSRAGASSCHFQEMKSPLVTASLKTA